MELNGVMAIISIIKSLCVLWVKLRGDVKVIS